MGGALKGERGGNHTKSEQGLSVSKLLMIRDKVWPWKVPRNSTPEVLAGPELDRSPCVPRAHQGTRGMPVASVKPGYKRSSENSRRQASGCLNIDNGNIPEDEEPSGEEKLEMPRKATAQVTVCGEGSQVIFSLARAGGGSAWGVETR